VLCVCVCGPVVRVLRSGARLFGSVCAPMWLRVCVVCVCVHVCVCVCVLCCVRLCCCCVVLCCDVMLRCVVWLCYVVLRCAVVCVCMHVLRVCVACLLCVYMCVCVYICVCVCVCVWSITHTQTATVSVFNLEIDFSNLRTEKYAEHSRIPLMVCPVLCCVV